VVTRDEWFTRDAAADDADVREVPPVIDCRWRSSAWAGFKEPPGCIEATCPRCGDCAKHCVCDCLDSLKGDDDDAT
jgi:hypothetical protein